MFLLLKLSTPGNSISFGACLMWKYGVSPHPKTYDMVYHLIPKHMIWCAISSLNIWYGVPPHPKTYDMVCHLIHKQMIWCTTSLCHQMCVHRAILNVCGGGGGKGVDIYEAIMNTCIEKYRGALSLSIKILSTVYIMFSLLKEGTKAWSQLTFFASLLLKF